MSAGEWDAVVLDARDCVATALRRLRAGETVSVRLPDRCVRLQVAEDIPLCHKVALGDRAAGAAIRKYGVTIGEATEAIGAGHHVHVHNLRSRRARADTAQAASRGKA